MGKLHFEIATPSVDADLRQFCAGVHMPGAIQLAISREPSYFEALDVEGRYSEVLICRDGQAGPIVAVGNRSIKSLFVNGIATSIGYLSGLRVAPMARRGQVLCKGYDFLRERHGDGRAPLYLTTVMEDNDQAKKVITTSRCGFPSYHDYGRFCCMALSLRVRTSEARAKAGTIRNATKEDAPVILAYLREEGRLRQFFPEYTEDDFGSTGKLLRGLDWNDIYLAFRDNELVGVLAAWDQQAFRQWMVSAYALWLKVLRGPYNVLAKLVSLPQMPEPGQALNFFTLSLVCIRHSDRGVFNLLLDEIVRQKQGRYSFFLAGLHERDPLLAELKTCRHFSLPSRLYVVCWEDGEATFKKIDRQKIPYLELGAL